MRDYTPQRTIKYKTYIKTAIVQGLQDVFNHHVDEMLRKTRVETDFPRTEADYPAVLVRFFERSIENAGVGHEEWIDIYDPEDGTYFGQFRFKHYFYKGDLEFAIYALSTYDRDLIADSLVQTLAMGDLEEYTNRFFGRVYQVNEIKDPDSISHYINLNTDSVMGFGEAQQQTPWASEDDLVYQASYRIGVFGEFYSLPPDAPAGFVEKVTLYPYIEGFEAVPTGDPNDQGRWWPPAS